MLTERLATYTRLNQELPERIIFFRDGLSTEQFQMCRKFELIRLKGCITRMYQAADKKEPDVMLICTVKRHNTRFYPHRDSKKFNQAHNGARDGNPSSGVAVFDAITYGDGQDFFLVSQDAAIGTARPTHYVVLHNEITTIDDPKTGPRPTSIRDIANMVSHYLWLKKSSQGLIYLGLPTMFHIQRCNQSRQPCSRIILCRQSRRSRPAFCESHLQPCSASKRSDATSLDKEYTSHETHRRRQPSGYHVLRLSQDSSRYTHPCRHVPLLLTNFLNSHFLSSPQQRPRIFETTEPETQPYDFPFLMRSSFL